MRNRKADFFRAGWGVSLIAQSLLLIWCAGCVSKGLKSGSL